MTEEKGLVLRGQTSIIKNMDDVERAALAMSKSGFFMDSRDAAQAVVKILAGQEMGFGPFASMTGVYIISGRPSIGANLMAAAVKKSGRYNYRVQEMTEKVCSIAFFENGQEIGVSTFTIDDARKAGTKNLDKYARNMLFARAMSNGCRWYCPDVFNGSAVYTPEELGANVNEDGDVIEVAYSRTAATGEEPPVVERKLEPMRQAPPPKAEPAPEPTGKKVMLAKIGKNMYPASWARFLAPYTRANIFEVDGILQKLNLPHDLTPDKVVDKINAYLDEKDFGAFQNDAGGVTLEI